MRNTWIVHFWQIMWWQTTYQYVTIHPGQCCALWQQSRRVVSFTSLVSHAKWSPRACFSEQTCLARKGYFRAIGYCGILWNATYMSAGSISNTPLQTLPWYTFCELFTLYIDLCTWFVIPLWSVIRNVLFTGWKWYVLWTYHYLSAGIWYAVPGLLGCNSL